MTFSGNIGDAPRIRTTKWSFDLVDLKVKPWHKDQSRDQRTAFAQSHSGPSALPLEASLRRWRPRLSSSSVSSYGPSAVFHCQKTFFSPTISGVGLFFLTPAPVPGHMFLVFHVQDAQMSRCTPPSAFMGLCFCKLFCSLRFTQIGFYT